ncbi:MAG: hypothetical protein QOI81_1002 [Actinomycetota bacterium]|jgi:hypothetical protein|nr:hypothetical protein [Actinomycetota bacterium]
MPKVVFAHAVGDVESWLTFKQERADAIGAMGGSNVTDLVAADGSKTVVVTADIQDVAAMTAEMASPSPELAAAIERHGAIQPIAIYIEG